VEYLHAPTTFVGCRDGMRRQSEVVGDEVQFAR
jgi:hypothetical protein